jgi:hypothetical protein
VANAVLDEVWDAAWVPLADGTEVDNRFHIVPHLQRGAARSAPGRGLEARYVVDAEVKVAAIDAVDPILPYYDKQSVGRVYTNRCTEPGDSGAVLFDADGNALGLASMRTVDKAVPAFSLWMWMPGVLDALGAELPPDRTKMIRL